LDKGKENGLKGKYFQEIYILEILKTLKL